MYKPSRRLGPYHKLYLDNLWILLSPAVVTLLFPLKRKTSNNLICQWIHCIVFVACRNQWLLKTSGFICKIMGEENLNSVTVFILNFFGPILAVFLVIFVFALFYISKHQSTPKKDLLWGQHVVVGNDDNHTNTLPTYSWVVGFVRWMLFHSN